MGEAGSPPPRNRGRRALWAAAILAVAAVGAWEARDVHLNAVLLREAPDARPADVGLTRFAVSEANGPYRRHCAGCHGADMKGLTKAHTPDLTDDTWLHGEGQVSDIERTILFGIRSGHGKARNVTDMPAFLFEGRLTRAEIDDVGAYIEMLSRQPHDAAASARGKAIFDGKGVCFDCHSAGGEGQPDFGAPSLRAGRWMYGGDPVSLRRSIAEGRHGLCPAWSGKLSPAVIRALAVKIHASRHS